MSNNTLGFASNHALPGIPINQRMSIEGIVDAQQPAVQAASQSTTSPSDSGSNDQQIKREVAQYTPGGSRSMATVSDFNELSDVLLGDEMSMMGCDVESWNSPERPQSLIPTTQSTPQQLQPQPQEALFTCSPTQLTRHTSLPVSSRPFHPPIHTGSPFAMQQPMVISSSIYSPHHRNYVVPHNQQVYGGFQTVPQHNIPLMVPPPLNHSLPNKLSRSQSVLEPISFSEQRMSLGDIDALALDMFNETDSKKMINVDNAEVNNLEVKDEPVLGRCSLGGGQELEKALNSLLPEMDQDLFHPSELNLMPPPSFVTPRNDVPSGRPSLPAIMSPNLKTMSTPSLTMALLQQQQIHCQVYTPTPRSSPKSTAACKVIGCERRVRSKGFCKTHGGGRKCTIEGCKKSSQNGEFCIGHGGGKKCRHEDCSKAAQSHGLCKAHGGGARCKHPNCNKSSQGGGLCRAHGGGKRCQAQHCPKGAQRGNFCATHGGFRNCKIEGCVRTDRGGGFCEVHRRGRLCNVDGCKKLARNEGMCTVHIREEKKELLEDTNLRATTPRMTLAAGTPRTASAVNAIEALAI